MPQEPVSPLRRRMIEDMTIRQFGAKTQTDYVRVVRDFAVFLGRSPKLKGPRREGDRQLRKSRPGAHLPIRWNEHNGPSWLAASTRGPATRRRRVSCCRS